MNSSTGTRAALALVFNAFVWGVSWWPFRALQDHGLHPLWATALSYVFALLGLLMLSCDHGAQFRGHVTSSYCKLCHLHPSPQAWCI